MLQVRPQLTEDQLKQIAQERSAIASQATQVRRESAVRQSEGTFTVTAIFCNHGASLEKKPGKNEPPKKLVCKAVGIARLSENPSDAFRVDKAGEIMIPRRNRARIREINKKIKATKDEAEKAKLNAELEEAKEPVDWIPLRDGDTLFVSTFDHGSVAKLTDAPSLVKLIGFEAEVSVTERGNFTNFGCQTVLSLGSDLSTLVNLNQQPVRLGSPENSETFLLLFNDYFRQDPRDGPVVQRILSNSQDPRDYKYGKEGEDPKPKMTLTLCQTQEASEGYPGGKYYVVTDFYDSEKEGRQTLRTMLGINDPHLFASIMACHQIPALVTCSINKEKTKAQNEGKNWATDAGNLIMWGNSSKFFLRDYLLQNCPQVSFSFVKEALGVEKDCADRYASVQLDNPNAPCLLNKRNLVNVKGKYTFVKDKDGVACATFYTGNLSHLKDEGCEWRVLRAQETDVYTRAIEADMPTDETEAFLRKLTVPFVIYAVLPYPHSDLVAEGDEIGVEEAEEDSKREPEEAIESDAPAKKAKVTKKKTTKK